PRTPAPLCGALPRYGDAKNPNDAAKAASDIVKAAPAFDEVYARLQRGRTYAGTPPTGIIRGRCGARFEYWLNVPASYDPARRYQARIQLHGGVMRPDASLRGDGSVRLPGDEQIYISPAGWSDAPWWSEAQVENVRLIVDAGTRTYNVTQNHV